MTDLTARQDKARQWFEALQGRIMAAMEALEDTCPGPFHPEASAPGRFDPRPWSRTDHSGAPGGGGRMAVLKGRVFEKMGVKSAVELANLLRERT